MSKILVTGGLGYIGSHAVVELIQSGFEPIVLDNLSESDITVKGRIESIVGRSVIFEKVELCYLNELQSVFDRHPDITGVIHFAAFLLVDESVQNPLRYYQNNLVSTMNLISVMKEKGVKPVVFSSSCTVYGEPEHLPVSEESPIRYAESPYGNTKKVSEDILRDCSVAYGLRTVSLRYFNPIGAHESGLIGEFQEGEPHHLVPYLTEIAIGKRKLLKVFGNDYDTRDGSCIRDYIHVVDIAKAHVSALRVAQKESQPPFDVINLGSGTGYSVLEMIESFEKSTGKKIPFEIAPRREGDVPAVYADISKARRVLGWEPTSSIDVMLSSAWKFEQALLK